MPVAPPSECCLYYHSVIVTKGLFDGINLNYLRLGITMLRLYTFSFIRPLLEFNTMCHDFENTMNTTYSMGMINSVIDLNMPKHCQTLLSCQRLLVQ